LFGPSGIAVDGSDNIYIAESNGIVSGWWRPQV
jgi:hypothetical protein